MHDVTRYALPVAMLLCLAACTAAPKLKLTPIPDEIPAGVSLAGRWELRDDGDAQSKVRDAEQQAAGRVSDALSKDRSNNNSRSKNKTSVHVFLETGSKLKITQTRDGLFVSFDRSVVEEYRYREQRFINVGPIVAERVSGWRQGRYVIQTLDDQGALLTETYGLVDEDSLERTIRIVYKDKETLSIRQQFDRVD